MNPPAGTGVCQGNFAASVKKILPIYERGILAVPASSQAKSSTNAESLRHQPLDRPWSFGIIQFTHSRVPGGSYGPTPGLQG